MAWVEVHRLQANLMFVLLDCPYLTVNFKSKHEMGCHVFFLSVHGGWGEWSSHWSECSSTCGLGIRTRERECDNPKPKYGGTPCDEQERQDVKYCRTQTCNPGLILRLLFPSFYYFFVAAFPQ